MSVSVNKFGCLPTGEEVKLYHLENSSGAFAEVISFGAILVKLAVPDREGALRDVVLGYDKLEQYQENGCFFGATIGRSGNRIAGAQFLIDETKVTLAQNENDNNLHSGPNGFEKNLWTENAVSQEKNSVSFYRVSPDGENGFPGEFRISVTYEFTDDNELKILYQGVSDRDTVANLTNHSYFNLAGEGSGSILDHELVIHADFYNPVMDSHSIPKGTTEPVKGTPMDFTTAKTIGRDINEEFDQLLYTGGYDHNYVTDGYAEKKSRLIANAWCQASGIVMDVFTDCPGVQFYAGNFIEQEHGKNGHIYDKRDGFCLETQVEPNAVNVPGFHTPILRAGEIYRSETVYRFRIK